MRVDYRPFVKWKLFTGVEEGKERLCSEGVSFEFLRNEIQIQIQ